MRVSTTASPALHCISSSRFQPVHHQRCTVACTASCMALVVEWMQEGGQLGANLEPNRWSMNCIWCCSSISSLLAKVFTQNIWAAVQKILLLLHNIYLGCCKNYIWAAVKKIFCCCAKNIWAAAKKLFGHKNIPAAVQIFDKVSPCTQAFYE